MKIYIAGSSNELDTCDAYMKRVRALGHTITVDWVGALFGEDFCWRMSVDSQPVGGQVEKKNLQSESEVAKRRRAIANIRSHEWAYIKTRETDRKNKVVISRCMHCKCERRKLHGGTGASFYSIPGEEQPVQACPPCTLETTESKPKGDDK